MGKVVTDEGITIESTFDSLRISGIPNEDGYRYGLFSIRYKWEDKSTFPPGTWKEIKDGETTYSLKDRGEGGHYVFISFAPRKEAQPEYTAKYVYGVDIAEDNQVTFPT
jgi:hypothetical protein